MMEEWRRETQVFTKRGSRDTKFRTTTLDDWKKTNPTRIGVSSKRLLKRISKKTETPHINKVAIKNAPALLSLLLLLPPPPALVLPLAIIV